MEAVLFAATLPRAVTEEQVRGLYIYIYLYVYVFIFIYTYKYIYIYIYRVSPILILTMLILPPQRE